MRVRVKCPAHCPPCHAGGPVCRAYNGTRPQKCSWPQLSWAPGSQQICLTQVTHAGKKIFLPHCFENPGWGSSRGNGKHRKCCGWVGWFFEEDNHRYMHRVGLRLTLTKRGPWKWEGGNQRLQSSSNNRKWILCHPQCSFSVTTFSFFRPSLCSMLLSLLRK